MEASYWLDRWETNIIGFNQMRANSLLCEYFKVLSLEKGDCIFVPLCGKTIDMLWLLSQGYTVIGVELSDKACEQFFTENGIDFTQTKRETFTVYQNEKITLYAGDFFALTPSHLKDIKAVYDRAALVALPTTMRKNYAQHLKAILPPSVTIFLNTMIYNQTDMPGPPFSIDKTLTKQLFGNAFTIEEIAQIPVKALPPHLIKKGLTSADQAIFKLQR